MNKKAFSTVELIVSFALAMSIAVLLFQIVISLRDLYVNNGIKTELLNKQSIITNKINTSFRDKGIYTITKCGSNCINFIYSDNTSEKLIIDKVNNTIEFGSYRTDLVKNSNFENILIDTFITPVTDSNKNDAFLIIDIPITNPGVKGEYGIHVLYQYNSKISSISDIIFDEDYNEYGYVILNGEATVTIDKNTTYVDDGYKSYDNNGKIIENSEEYVKIDNPFTSLSLPYKAGIYEVKYNLYDSQNKLVSSKTRKVYVYPNLTNLIPDGSMENDGWNTCVYSTDFSKYGSKSCKLEGSTTWYEQVAPSKANIPLDNSHTYYARIEAYQTTKTVGGGVQFYWPIAEPSIGTIGFKEAGTWQSYSFRITRTTFTNGSYPIRIDYNNEKLVGTVYYDGFILIDLTETFGVGKEPSKEWCDQNIPYFDTSFKLDVLP